MTKLHHDDYTVGWICALPLEMAAAKAMLDEVHDDLPIQPTQLNDHNAYTLGRIGKHNIAIACLPSGEYGIASASTVAMQLLSSFKSVKLGLLVGIGGGIPSKEADIRLGDVVVGLPTSRSTNGGVVQYDLGKVTVGGKFERTGSLNRPPQILATAVSKLQAIHKMEGSRISKFVVEIGTKWPKMRDAFTGFGPLDRLFNADYPHDAAYSTCEGCDLNRLVKRPERASREPVVHYGLIASGNTVVKDSHLRDLLAHELGALCVEMEAAGLANNYPCLVIRGICDYADSHKNKEWQGRAAAAAAAYAKELLLVTPDASVEPRLTDGDNDGDDDGGDLAAFSKMREQDCLLSLRPTNAEIPRVLPKSAARSAWNQIYERSDYDRWYQGNVLDTDNGLIWIKGKPGSGKSTFMKHAFCQAVEDMRGESCLVAASFFNALNKDTRWSKLDIFRILLYQLLSSNNDDLSRFMDMFDHKFQSLHSEIEWTADELQHFFKDTFSKPRPARTLLFVDALDECTEEEMRGLAFFFRELTSTASTVGSKLSVCLSSRDFPKVSVQNCPEIMIDRLNTSDIRRYVHQRFKTAGLSNYTEWVTLTGIIVDKSAGVFLWVVIMVDAILKDFDDGRSFGYLERRLRETPRALEQLYEQILLNINLKDRQMTMRFFNWVIFSLKPLRLVEWHHILAMIRDEPPKSLRQWRDSQYFTETALQLERRIQSISRGLVEVKARETPLVFDDRNSIHGEAGSLNSEEGETRVVRTIHSSVSEFFISGSGFQILNSQASVTPGSGDLDIMTTCLNYVSIRELDALAARREKIGPRRQPIRRATSEASFGSSASNFSKQYRARHDDNENSASRLFLGIDRLGSEPSTPEEDKLVSSQLPRSLKGWLEAHMSRSFQATAEQASIGARSLDSGGATSQVMEDYPALFSYALDAFPVHAAIADQAGANPRTILEQLLADRMWQRWLYLEDRHMPATTLLYYAVEQKLNSWVTYLLSNDADPNMQGGPYLYPLIAAVQNQNLEAMIQLLKSGALWTVEDDLKRTPLHFIAQNGYLDVLSRFIETIPSHRRSEPGFIDAVDNEGHTPLHLSVRNNHFSMTKKLLELGADPNCSSDYGKTALHDACECEEFSWEICQALLSSGARTNTLCEDGLLPSQRALQMNNMAAVSLINEHPLSNVHDESGSRSTLTVKMIKITEMDSLKRPYLLVSLNKEIKILHPIDSPGDEGQWNELRFLLPLNIETSLDLCLIDATSHNSLIFFNSLIPRTNWSIKISNEDGRVLKEIRRSFSEDKWTGLEQEVYKASRYSRMLGVSGEDRPNRKITVARHRHSADFTEAEPISITLEAIIPPKLELRASGKMILRDPKSIKWSRLHRSSCFAALWSWLRTMFSKTNP